MRLRAFGVLAAGAAGSIALLLRAGSRQPSAVLMAMFVGWVLAPFAALGWAVIASKSWPPRLRAALYGLVVIVTALSLAMYGRLIPMPSSSRPAAMFLLVPLFSWVLFAILTAALRPRPGRS